MPKKKNLWFSLLFLFLGTLLLKLSFFIAQKAAATTVLIMGIISIAGALIIFWKNFRE
jgi:uncharacterized membrane protein HdeD (DUF308 family)